MRKHPILIVEDEPEMRQALFEGLSKNGYQIYLAENASGALRLFEQRSFDLVIADIQLPDQDGLHLLSGIKDRSVHTPVIMMTAYGSVQNAVEAMRKGALDYLLKPFSLETLEERVRSVLRDDSPGEDNPPESIHPPDWPTSIVTRDRKMKEVIDLCDRIARSKATVLIQGESGTGKELFARYIHNRSQREQGPYVAVNCASLPESLLESELFGHEKGAFTGAISRKIGKFEMAHRGTILLDEISEMNTFLQAKILRVLQENEVDRIGGGQPIPIDIRVIATTNRNLDASIEKGEFREDLYFRLNVISLKLPPLRVRPDDIELLARHFLKTFSMDYGKPIEGISETAMEWLRKQEWRGNVRELKNSMERAVLVSSQSVLDVADFFSEDRGENRPVVEPVPSTLSLREMEKTLIERALDKTSGNRTHAARILGISIRTLRNKLNEYKQELSV